MTYEWPMMPPEDQCTVCNNRCIHGMCDCSAEMCVDCWKKWNLAQEAEREANFQRNVMGPLLGFVKGAEYGDQECPNCGEIHTPLDLCDKEAEHVHDWRGIDTGRMCAICCLKEDL